MLERAKSSEARATPRREQCESRQICPEQPLPANVYSNSQQDIVLPWTLILRSRSTICNIRWRKSTSAKVICRIFSIALTVTEIFIYIVRPETCIQSARWTRRTWCPGFNLVRSSWFNRVLSMGSLLTYTGLAFQIFILLCLKMTRVSQK